MTTSNITKVTVTPAMQTAEAERLAEADAATGVEDALDLGGGEPQDDQPGDRQEEPAPRPKPISRSPSDLKRDAIAARFSRTESVPFNGDMTDPEMLYGIHGRQPAAEVEPGETIVGEALGEEDPQDQPVEQQPQMITRTVRGKAVTKSLDDWLVDATKVTAADSYFEDARKLLEDAKVMRADRAGQDRQHPDGEQRTQDDELDNDEADRTRHPAPDFKSVVEKIQFGDPEEAARDLKAIVDRTVSQNVDETQLNRLFNNDLAASQKALKDFEEKNPEIAKDKIARLAIEQTMYGFYVEDLKALGYEESKLPKNPRDLANWHRFSKVNGHAVRSTPELLEKAKGEFVKWRGGPLTPKPAPRKEAARVEVNVNRTERRLAIPNQPNRAAVPRRDATPQAPAKTAGSDIVRDMRKARGQPVG